MPTPIVPLTRISHFTSVSPQLPDQTLAVVIAPVPINACVFAVAHPFRDRPPPGTVLPALYTIRSIGGDATPPLQAWTHRFPSVLEAPIDWQACLHDPPLSGGCRCRQRVDDCVNQQGERADLATACVCSRRRRDRAAREPLDGSGGERRTRPIMELHGGSKFVCSEFPSRNRWICVHRAKR